MDLEELLAALDDDDAAAELTDDQLAAAADELRELIAEATDGDDPDVDLADELVPALSRVVHAQQARQEAHDARLERAQAIRREAGLEPDDDPVDVDDQPDGDPSDDAADVEQRQPEPAVASTAALLDRLRAAARRSSDDDPPAPRTTLTVRPVGPAAGGDLQLGSLRDAATLFSRYASHVGRQQRSSLVRFDLQLPPDRVLGDDAEANTRRMDAVTSQRAVTASGGICAPVEADYSHPICGDRGRPIRDALPTFQASRGGIRYAPAPSLSDVAGGITVWTAANDAAGSPNPASKACPEVDCPTEVSVSVDAVVACLTVGNFQARFSPEFWASRLDLLMVAHDRQAEKQLLAGIDASSTAVTYASGSGTHTVVDVLAAVDKATAGLASRHRIIGGTYVAIVPDWLPNAFRAALGANQSSNRLEAYQAADAQLAAFWAARNVRPVYTPDDDVFGDQSSGALAEFPGGDVKVRVFPEGTFTFLDGGVLDLGTEVTDSTLNSTNDRQAFIETFEQVAFRGCESLTITVPATEGCVCATAVPAASP